jgi:hypothetical protein
MAETIQLSAFEFMSKVADCTPSNLSLVNDGTGDVVIDDIRYGCHPLHEADTSWHAEGAPNADLLKRAGTALRAAHDLQKAK